MDIFFKKLAGIKESWEIFEIFEEEREKFIAQSKQYHAELERSQELLAGYRAQILECKNHILELKKQAQVHEDAIALLEEKRIKRRIEADMDQLEMQKQEIQESQREILPECLKKIEVFDENGEIKHLESVRRVYDSEMFNKYRITLKENRTLLNRISEYELENSQLRIELRDLRSEIALSERLMQKSQQGSEKDKAESIALIVHQKPQKILKLLVSALEPSSNEHLKTLIKALDEVELDCKIQLEGIFDAAILQNLRKNSKISGQPIFGPKDFSVMVFTDVIKKLGFILSAQKKMCKMAENVDKVLLLDSSSFHLPLAKKIKKKFPKVEVIYYILPQIWAWKSWRAKTLIKVCDRLLAILPFETPYYQGKARYVGHPLLDSIQNFKSSPNGEGIVFMPGSRQGEIKRIFPIFCQLAREKFKDKKRLLVVPKMYKGADLRRLYGDGLDLFEVCYDAHQALLRGEFAFICSGTATLEAALIGIPFVLGYKANSIDFYILRMLVHLNCIGLANIFYQALKGEKPGSGESRLHAELIQNDLNVESLFEAYKKTDTAQFFDNARCLRDYLRHGSARRVLSYIVDLKS